MNSETQPNKLSDTQPRNAGKPVRGAFLISLLVLVAALVLGTTAGAGEGIRERVSAQETQVTQTLAEQFALAQQDFAEGNYDATRQRLEYILKQDGSFPGASDLLTKVIVQMVVTPSPEPTLTPTITPTPDLRSQDAIFAEAQQQLKDKDWTAVMASLDSLRKADPTYKAAQVDGMYYTSLRNRGTEQILGIGPSNQSNLEGGIYDLTLAERFGPLDGYADGLRSFARLFITGASFWQLDWGQAANYFGQVYQYAPNLRDASNVTAGERYREALLHLGDQQAAAPRLKDRCLALNSWAEANNVATLNGEYGFKYNALDLECNPPTPTVDPASLNPPPVEAPPAEVPTDTPPAP